MWTLLGLPIPEREIGRSAHDFVQAMGAPEVFLVWAKRIEGEPAIPSRWILRLQMLLKAAKCEDVIADNLWRAAVEQLDRPLLVRPIEKPRAKPPAAARLRRMSVSRVERLIRDPYAIYAEQILDLKPLPEMNDRLGAAQRGVLIHDILSEYIRRNPHAPPDDIEEELLRIGATQFTPFLDDPEVTEFWWPQFQQSVEWLANWDREQRADVVRSWPEVSGGLELEIAGQPFRLTCRADRIDILRDGTAHILDYKTGEVPSGKQVQAGLAPQLTLEAAMLERGAFAKLGRREASGLSYVKLRSTKAEGEMIPLKFDVPLMDQAGSHFDHLRDLLTHYASAQCCYLPRTVAEADDELDYDHLSRYREWALSGSPK
jgi:ATP-dependent helicase/nuclease subunit B